MISVLFSSGFCKLQFDSASMLVEVGIDLGRRLLRFVSRLASIWAEVGSDVG